MANKYVQLVLTPAVQRAQDKYFGKHQVVENAPETDALTLDEVSFITSRDSFYMATVSETAGRTFNIAEAQLDSSRCWDLI